VSEIESVIEGEVTPKIAAGPDDLARMLGTMTAQAEENAWSKFVGSVESVISGMKDKATQPPEKRERHLPEPDVRAQGDTANYNGYLADARDYQYSRLFRTHPMLKGQRDPKIDAQMARWIRASAGVTRDPAILVEWEARSAEAVKRADLLEGTTTATSGLSGGTAAPLIPLPLHNQLVLLKDRASVIRPFCRVVTSDALTLRVPVSGAATAAMTAEGSSATNKEPTLTSVLLHKKKMMSGFEASEESLMDSAFNVVSFFTERAASAMGALEDVQICTSNATAPELSGSLEAPNINSAGAQVITTFAEATSTVITYADMLGMWFGVGKQYRNNAVWMGNTALVLLLSQLDDANGRPIFAPSGSPGAPVSDLPGVTGTIFGRPVLEVPTSAGNLFFADMSYYFILEGQRMSMKSSDAVLWSADTVSFKITNRLDGAITSIGTSGNYTMRICAGLTSAA